MKRECSVTTCSADVVCKGMCRRHYNRVIRGADPEKPFRHARTGTCSMPECELDVFCLGLCSSHYSTGRLYGDPALMDEKSCTINKLHPGPFHIDHDHSCCAGPKTCGKCVRGVLCSACNQALGFARDDADTLRALADYLERKGAS